MFRDHRLTTGPFLDGSHLPLLLPLVDAWSLVIGKTDRKCLEIFHFLYVVHVSARQAMLFTLLFIFEWL